MRPHPKPAIFRMRRKIAARLNYLWPTGELVPVCLVEFFRDHTDSENLWLLQPGTVSRETNKSVVRRYVSTVTSLRRTLAA